ncbi:MAG: hypothetical protein ACREU7_13980 [Burkholderiales bacterium]
MTVFAMVVLIAKLGIALLIVAAIWLLGMLVLGGIGAACERIHYLLVGRRHLREAQAKLAEAFLQARQEHEAARRAHESRVAAREAE